MEAEFVIVGLAAVAMTMLVVLAARTPRLRPIRWLVLLMAAGLISAILLMLAGPAAFWLIYHVG